jgi:hypothetical protein
MRRRRFWKALLAILCPLAVSLVIAAWPGTSTFTVSKETTYVTEPLDKYGYVDYVVALNEYLRKGVTPENNANVLIWQALGPHPEGGTMPPEYFQWLGMESPPEEGAYLARWSKFMLNHPLVGDGKGDAPPHAEPLEFPTRPWKTADRPILADWLEVSEKPLALILEATRRTEYYNPLTPKRTGDWSPGILGSYLPCVQACREVASALVCRAMLRVSDGKVEEAWRDLLACHRLGRLIGRGATSIELLVGLAIDQTATKGDLAFLEHAGLTAKQLKAYFEDLRRLPPIPVLADKLDHCERLVCLELMMLCARHGPEFLQQMDTDKGPGQKANPYTSKLFTRSIDWDPGMRKANRWFDRIAACLRLPDRDAREQELGSIENEWRAMRSRVKNIGPLDRQFIGPQKRGELMGDIVVGLLTPAFRQVHSACERVDQIERNRYIAFALAAYQRDQGRYPATLIDLAPKYLDKVPNDLFSGKPLIYRPEGKAYLLYSVGVNGIDENGRGNDDEPKGDDLAVRIPAPQPPGKE